MKRWVTQAEMEKKAQQPLDKALRELCTKRKRTAAGEHEITECLVEAAHSWNGRERVCKAAAEQSRAA